MGVSPPPGNCPPSTCALQGFVKQMLDVADNLERAAGAVPEAALGAGQEIDPAEVQKQLRTLLEGVKLTQQVLNQVNISCYGWSRSRNRLANLPSGRLAFQLVSATAGFPTQWRRAVSSGGGDV